MQKSFISSLIDQFTSPTTDLPLSNNDTYRNALEVSFDLETDTIFAQQVVNIFSQLIHGMTEVKKGQRYLDDLISRFERLDDPLKASSRVFLYEMLADLYECGVEYKDGRIEADAEKARQYREAACADTTLSELIVQQTSYFYKVALEGKDPQKKEAAECLGQLARLGHPFAQWKFAYFLERTQQQCSQMLGYYIVAASEQRPFFKNEPLSYYRQAKLHLAWLYLRGIYVPRSEQMGWDYVRFVLRHSPPNLHGLVQSEFIGEQLSQKELLKLGLLGLQAAQQTTPSYNDALDEKPLGMTIAEQCIHFVSTQPIPDENQPFYDGLCLAIADYYENLAVNQSTEYIYEPDDHRQSVFLPNSDMLKQAVSWLKKISPLALYTKATQDRILLHSQSITACQECLLPEGPLPEESQHFQAMQVLQQQPRDKTEALVIDMPESKQPVFTVSDLLAWIMESKEPREWIDPEQYFLIYHQQQEGIMPKESTEQSLHTELNDHKVPVTLPAGIEPSQIVLTSHQLIDKVQEILPEIEEVLSQYLGTYYAELKTKRLEQVQSLKDAIAKSMLTAEEGVIYVEAILERGIRKILSNPGGSAWFRSKLDSLIVALKGIILDVENGKIKLDDDVCQTHIAPRLIQASKQPVTASWKTEVDESLQGVEKRLESLQGVEKGAELLKVELLEVEKGAELLKVELLEKESVLEEWAQQQEELVRQHEELVRQHEERARQHEMRLAQQEKLFALEKSNITFLASYLLTTLPQDKRATFEEMFTALQKQSVLIESSNSLENTTVSPSPQEEASTAQKKPFIGDNTGKKPISFRTINEEIGRKHQLRRLIRGLTKEGFVCSVKWQGLQFSLEVSNSQKNFTTPELDKQLANFTQQLQPLLGLNIKDFVRKGEFITWAANNDQKATALCELLSECNLIAVPSQQAKPQTEHRI